MKKCRFCAEEVQDEAIKCKHCGSALDDHNEVQVNSSPSAAPSNTGFSILGLVGAFIALVGLAIGCTAGANGNPTLAIVGIVILIIGAGIGAKNK